MYLNHVVRSKIFEEFTPEKREKFFSITEKKVVQHIDTFYYSVQLENDCPNNEDYGLNCLLSTLASLKEEKQNCDGKTIVEISFVSKSNIKISREGTFAPRKQMDKYYNYYYVEDKEEY